MKSLYLAGVALSVVATATVASIWIFPRPAITDLPATVVIEPGPFSYRPAGVYRFYGKLVDAPLETEVADKPLEIMKFQVSRAEYAACVADGACQASVVSQGGSATSADLPQTEVNWYDATAYAAWFSRQTRQHWRLPDDREWQRAAAERFFEDEIVPEEEDDPAQRWLAAYARNVAARGSGEPEPQPRGSFGENSHGVADMAGNVWEWTTTCVANSELTADGVPPVKQEYCGAHIAEGKHRAIIIDLVRNPKVGGCAVGLPADYVGFRLVRAR
ncbi:SUMF1/EgtB/PvdO family nonheme iron enzyme [Labrenzia sp. 011]|uniref:SUMF1/EgtB/PvdO family nonheme iron enzyme n=1 Tax=Labrenzia sp. 011 TaxID=2171494 RepID=UPI000D50CE59|nr:SUMF1/EgtB/PvdO family nonheme iron enzyme [Labrenzia sp. 011]PVB61497.1 NirV [Labrenzia sp. 011]